MMTPFQSFIWAGFECTYARVSHKRRLDLLGASQHDRRAPEDYALISSMGIKTVREGFAWHAIDRGNGTYDFSRFEPLLAAGHHAGIQQIWDLNHFDFPDGTDVFSDSFVERFTLYGLAVVAKLRQYYARETLYLVPLNEISFFSWIGADQGAWAPFLSGGENGYLFKKQLVRLALAAMKAIRSSDPGVLFIHVDPFMHRFPARGAPGEIIDYVAAFNREIRYQSWDMLAGMLEPELGGNMDYIDYIGVNYYLHNQEWIRPSRKQTEGYTHKTLAWNSQSRLPLSDLLRDIYARYGKPIVLSETGSYGNKRQRWWDHILTEAQKTINLGIPLHGICAYPVLDRPKGAGFIFPHSGLIDFDMNDPGCARKPFLPAIEKIRKFQQKTHSLKG